MTIITASTPQECILKNYYGLEYAEFSCVHPWIKPFYTRYEAEWDTNIHKFMTENNWIPVVAVTLYALFIFLGRKAMEDKQPWKSRPYLAMWNLGLSVFSFCGVLRCFPNLLDNLLTMSLRDNFCLNPQITYGSGSTGLWVIAFILSKFPELFDTLFIVINKKPLILLHWYHHITVLLFCWHSYVTFSPMGIFFACMNYTVHGFMYGYYFLMAIKMKPKWMNPMFITTIQIVQMIGGVSLTLTGFYYYMIEKEGECYVNKENNVAAFLMYGSYLFLFCQFFFSRYFKASVKAIEKKKA